MTNLKCDYHETKHRNQPIFRCDHCKFDTFTESAIHYHINQFHPNIPHDYPAYDIPLETWVANEINGRPHRNVQVTLGLLTWNNDTSCIGSSDSIKNEAMRLKLVGVDARVVWLDNGSTDDTRYIVWREWEDFGYETLHNQSNLGASIARNQIIDRTLQQGSHYLFMMDGDVQLIPWSVYALIDYMRTQPTNTGCTGFYSPNCAPIWEPGVARDCRKLYPSLIRSDSNIAWTQYGLFRTEMFKYGVRFDENEVFRGPGWGLEDDDLYLQMRDRGYESHHTRKFKHIHRNRHGSIGLIGRDKAIQIFVARQTYLRHKWGEAGARLLDAETLPNL